MKRINLKSVTKSQLFSVILPELDLGQLVYLGIMLLRYDLQKAKCLGILKVIDQLMKSDATEIRPSAKREFAELVYDYQGSKDPTIRNREIGAIVDISCMLSYYVINNRPAIIGIIVPLEDRGMVNTVVGRYGKKVMSGNQLRKAVNQEQDSNDELYSDIRKYIQRLQPG